MCRWNEIVGHFREVAALLKAHDIGLLVFLYPTWPEGNDWANYGEGGHQLRRELVAELESLGPSAQASSTICAVSKSRDDSLPF